MPEDVKDRLTPSPAGMSDQRQTEIESSPLTRRETLELVRAYYRVTNPGVRKRMFELVKSLAKMSDPA
jgi:hypothetical protein